MSAVDGAPSGPEQARDASAADAGKRGPLGGRAALRHARRDRLQRLLDHEEAIHQPEWMRPSEGEPLWPVAVAVLAAVGLQLAVPERLAVHPKWLLPSLVLGLLIVLVAIRPARVRQGSVMVQVAGLLLVIIAAFANAYSAVKLVLELLHGKAGDNPTALLGTGAAIYITNVICFALWYWAFDQGGPRGRAVVKVAPPDFLFPQMTLPEMFPRWHPEFGDYLYLAFTNATAFSPTDTLPTSRWAKMTMMLQSAVALVIAALVVARVVNVLH
jgi:hypothetical protein